MTDQEKQALLEKIATLAEMQGINPDTIRQRWRIGRQAKDMTDPAVLFIVIQAWLDHDPTRRSERIEWVKELKKWRVVFYEYEEAPLCLTVFRSHADRTTAEALAFLGVLEENWGDENG